MLMNAFILGMRVDTVSYESATDYIISWAKSRESRVVYAANVHMVMEAYDNPDFQNIINQADLVTPDGMPLVWNLRLQGYRKQTRVYGPDLTLHVAKAAADNNIPVGLFGSTPKVTESLARNLQKKFPGLQIVYCYSPPFRSLTIEENQQITMNINGSGARILFVGLGCPKQERWIAQNRDRVKAVMMGVGVAFDFHAGHKPQAPRWIQNLGLEWLFRLISEPRRLWRRYLFHNPRFLLLATKELLITSKLSRS